VNKVLWALQILLALAFVAHGILFLAPPPEIAVQMNAFLPRWFQLFLGIAELLAGIGLTVPGVTRIKPALVPAAAIGVLIVTVSATVLHGVRGEYSSAATTLVLSAIAAFVAHGRSRRLPILPRESTLQRST
jgi:putative oxidoreductase